MVGNISMVTNIYINMNLIYGSLTIYGMDIWIYG